MNSSRHESLEHGYETRDARLRPILIFAAGLAALALVSVALMSLLQSRFEADAASHATEPVHPLAQDLDLFPEPRLQEQAAQDMEQHRAWEEQLLDSYGWIDRERERVRIPVSEAMERVAREGLPQWSSAEEDEQ